MKKIVSLTLWGVVLVLLTSFFLPWMKFGFAEIMPANERQTFKRQVIDEDQRSWIEKWFFIRPEEKEKALKEPFLGDNALVLINLLRDKPGGSEVKLALLRPHFPFRKDEDKVLFILSLPVLGTVAVVIFILGRVRRILLPFAFFITLSLYLAARWHIEELYAERVIYDVEIGLGYWLTLYALLVVCAVSSIKTVVEIFRFGGG